MATEEYAPDFDEPLREPATHAELAARFARRQEISARYDESDQSFDMPDDLY